jgi:hypothetical protein
MSACTYCNGRARWKYVLMRGSQPVPVCGTCHQMIRDGQLVALAIRWVSYRPQDWVDEAARRIRGDFDQLATVEPLRGQRRPTL